MLLKRFYDDTLAQASYLIGCAATGEALIVDPNRDVDQYIEAAEAEGMRITHVTETHIHADFVSGARELAHRTGARLYLSDEGGPDWAYGFAGGAGAVLMKDGHTFMVGNIRIEARHTPGHTPEHMTFVVTDTPATDVPMGALTGDFVFVGDVGRPDLLERAAGFEGTMERGARQLFQSLQAFRRLPDHLQIWPGHGAGSACGKALGAVPSSTLGYERIANWALRIDDERAFVQEVLAGQPEPPKYFAEMKRINRDGPRLLGALRRPPRVPLARITELVGSGAFVVDTRAAADFAAGHLAGTINIPLNRAFTTWAGWLVPYTRDFYLIVDHDRAQAVDEVVKDLALIGLDRIGGFLALDERELEAWRAAGGRLETIAQITPDALQRRLAAGDVTVIDVRGRFEWETGRLPGAPNVPLGYLGDRLAEVPVTGTVVLQCESGSRSAIAASLLQAHGRRDVANLVGGFSAWRKAGLPVERPAPEPVAVP
ncbi:MAG TPA: rhodanese-like domain-containing protein [Gemmatimonadales bacterium]|nr:rhodanese-like domain-containing protein [Gemmatimonadales bacterium]